MKVESHILDREGHCSRCRINLGGTALLIGSVSRPREPMVGDRIGLITELKFTDVSAYLITQPEHDSNRLCVEKGQSIP